MTEEQRETERRLKMAVQRAEKIQHAMSELQQTIPRELLHLTTSQRGAYMVACIQLAEAHRSMSVAISNLKFAHQESPK